MAVGVCDTEIVEFTVVTQSQYTKEVKDICKQDVYSDCFLGRLISRDVSDIHPAIPETQGGRKSGTKSGRQSTDTELVQVCAGDDDDEDDDDEDGEDEDEGQAEGDDAVAGEGDDADEQEGDDDEDDDDEDGGDGEDAGEGGDDEDGEDDEDDGDEDAGDEEDEEDEEEDEASKKPPSKKAKH
eukprot:TRINITY_DN325_c0_g1_i1.p1 TRINITY_DN325_c0_g1~~TRINITY_DN325_c0_g1_i1.p1  ORF type:complete len:183 (-),score=66.17 TRINITY_DN325_c0_g1_i1:419-967(-)